MAAGNLTRRIAFAAVAIPAVLGAGWLGGWVLAGLLAVAGALGARELYDFASRQGVDPMRRLGMLGAAGAPLVMAAGLVGPLPGLWAVLLEYGGAAWLLILLGAAVPRRGPGGKPLAAVAVTVLGAMYAGWLPGFALLLRHPPGRMVDAGAGTALLFFPLVLTWVGDTAAYAGGTLFGGARMAPVVSPNKTWAGAVAGLLGTVATGLGYSAVVFRAVGVSVSVVEALVLGAVISVVGQYGDIAESLFKREAGLKDSSAIIPGHGGVLDRLDSLYFALPATVLLMRAMEIA